MKGILSFILILASLIIFENKIYSQTPARTAAITAISDSLPNNNLRLIKPSSLRYALLKMLSATKDSADIITIINLQKNIPNGVAGLDGAGKVLLSEIPTETDPTVPAIVKAITSTNISNWNIAFSWGNHASYGYITYSVGDLRYALAAHTHAFNTLTGLNFTSLLNGQYLQYNSATGKWINATISGFATTSHTHSLSDLTQSGASINQIPQWNGSQWVPVAISGSTGGTVTILTKTDGYGIISSITNPNTTPNHTITLDTATVFPAIRATISGGSGGANNYVTGLSYATGTLTLNRNGLADLTTSIPQGTVTTVGFTNTTGITWTITNPGTTPNLSLALTAASVGLSNVNNTSDANKPVSIAQAAADALKVNISDTAAMLSPYLRVNVATATYVNLGTVYTNPSWVGSLDASKLTSGLIPAGRYGATTIPVTAINATGGGTGKLLSYDGTWITPAAGTAYTAGWGILLPSTAITVDSVTIAAWLRNSHPYTIVAKGPALNVSATYDTIKFLKDSSGLVKGMAIRSNVLYDTINGVEVSVGSVGGGGSADYILDYASAASNYTAGSATYVVLPDLTGQANRTITLPGSPVNGRSYIYENNNPSTSGNTWTFSSSIPVKDNNGNTVTTLTNRTVYHLVYNATNFRIIN